MLITFGSLRVKVLTITAIMMIMMTVMIIRLKFYLNISFWQNLPLFNINFLPLSNCIYPVMTNYDDCIRFLPV